MSDSQASDDLELVPEESEVEQYVEYQLTSYPTDYTLAVFVRSMEIWRHSNSRLSTQIRVEN